LYAVLPLRLTVTGDVAHLHVSVPPAKLGAPFFTPPSTAGWIEIAMTFVLSRVYVRSLEAVRSRVKHATMLIRR
jgi:uncharacterized membrane protein (DUF485 family)